MIRVLVADDHAVVRRGLAHILEEAPDMTLAGEASSGRQVLRAVRQGDYDVLVLDIAMPEGGGLEVLHQLRTLQPKLPVLMLSVYAESQYALRALKAGAAGYLTKASAPDELVAAIRRVARGKRYVSGPLGEEIVAALRQKTGQEPHAAGADALSDRECQVVCLLASGKTLTEIAADLSLSAKTVGTYRARALKKLRLKSTADLIRYALDHGLVE